MRSFDAELISQICKKDDAAFGIFYQETVDIFFRYISGRYYMHDQEIEDFLSDFYVKMRQAVEKYDASYAFESFVWTVFKNYLKDHFKKKSEQHTPELDMQEDGDHTDMMDMIEQQFQREHITQAWKELDEGSQDILFLKYIEERSYDEIAEILQISHVALRKRHSRALQKLKELLSILG